MKKVLLIGWDGADWKVIHPLLDAGKLPNLENLINNGVMGNLATLYPSYSPTLWTSIATGKRPFKHRVLGFIEPDPSGEGARPVTTLTRQSRALWNIFTLLDKKSVVVGWWPSHPAEPINGVMVSNHYQKAIAPYGKPWPMAAGTVHPLRLFNVLKKLRFHPQEVPVEIMLKFLPKLSEIDQEKDRKVESVAKIIAENISINRAFTAILDHEYWEFSAVYFDGIDHFSHGFMNFHPPKLPWVNEKDYELYKNVVNTGYELHDFLLGTILKRVDDNTLVILVSDHGFHSDHLRPKNIPNEPAGPAAQHRHYGIFVVKGPNIKKDEIIYGATLLDIAPTILAALGLPVGEDMDGKVLLNIFEKPPEIKTIPSWDEIKGEDGSHPEYVRLDPEVQKEAMNQLVDLGYIEEVPSDRHEAAENALREWRYNEALSYMDAGLHVKAIPIFEDLLNKYPDEYRFGIKLVDCYIAVDRIKEAKDCLEIIVERKKSQLKTARKELKEWFEKRKNKKIAKWSKKEQQEFRKLRARAGFNPFAVEYLFGVIALRKGNANHALKHFEKAKKLHKGFNLNLLQKIGESYLYLKKWEEAQNNFRMIIEKDSENAEAMAGIAEALLGLRKNKEALEWAIDAVSLRFHFPKAHFILGVAFHRLNEIPEAIKSFELAIHQNPNYVKAYQRLAYIYGRRLGNKIKAKKYRELAIKAKKNLKYLKKYKKNEKFDESKGSVAITSDLVSKEVVSSFTPNETIVIVSGLPRSGTSMMMQMLKAGGLEILTDEVRRPDESNPKGYYEYEKVKSLKKDASWLKEAKGKAVKIVAPLINFLPINSNYSYRIIFMMRNLDEVVSSQQKMLKRQDKKGASISKSNLKRAYISYLQQAISFINLTKIPAIFVDYHHVLKDPKNEIGRIKKFLGDILDEDNMIKVVDHSLYREKVKQF